jgi:signal transduction histidine kinase
MVVSAAWIGPAVLGAINEIVQQQMWGATQVRVSAILFASGDWLLYAFLTPAVFAIAARWPLSRPQLPRRALLHLGISLLFCAAWASTGTGLKILLQPDDVASGISRYFVSWLFITLPFGVAVYFAVVGIEHATRYFAEARDRELQVVRLSEQLSGARFAALQAQLNPHFLFNTLNTIAVLVRDGDTEHSARIIAQLGDLLRRTLTRHRTNEVPLEDELELVRQYLAIEQARFSDRLHATFAIEDAVRTAAVPSFALQHLVENAIRHGIARRSSAGLVRVTARRDQDVLELSIVDDGPGVDADAAGRQGRGIHNTRERLRALYGDRASLAVASGPTGGTTATLRIPYREMAPGSGDGDLAR